MTPRDEKPKPGEEAKEAKPSRTAEARRIVEEYATDLREIIKKLRGGSIEPMTLLRLDVHPL